MNNPGSLAPTGIETLESEKEKGTQTVYDMNGIRLDKPRKGLNLVRMPDGSVRKVIFR